MKATLNTKTIAYKLSVLAKIIKTDTVVPIISGYRFEFKDGFLNISTTDLECDGSTSIKCDYDDDGLFVVMSNKKNTFLSIIKTIKDKEVKLESKDNTLIVKAARKKYKFPICDADNFPDRSHSQKEVSEFKVDAELLTITLSNASSMLTPSSVSDAHKAVCLKAKDKSMRVYAIHRNYVMYASYMNKQGGGEISCNIGGKLTSVLRELNPTGDMDVILYKDRVCVKYADFVFTTTTMDFKYPQIESLSKGFNTDKTVVIEKSILLDVIDRMMVTTDLEYSPMKIEFSKSSAKISSDDDENNTGAYEEVDLADNKSEGEIITVSSVMMRMAINKFDGSDNIRLYLQGGKKHLYLTDSINDNLDRDYVILAQMDLSNN